MTALWDVFICHATEDKDVFVRALADELRRRTLRVWYDEYELRVGDRLLDAIDRGLANSKYGVVVLSQAFFKKEWTRTELNALANREVDGHKVILPVWLDVQRRDVAQYSTVLAGRVAVKASSGVSSVAEALMSVLLRPPPPDGAGATEPNPSPITGGVARADGIVVGGSRVPLPSFYPSVSSAGTRLRPLDCVRLFARGTYPAVLVSAYDLYRADDKTAEKLRNALLSAKSQGTRVALDSGNYEAFWSADNKWKPSLFWQILQTETYYDLAFSYDGHPDRLVSLAPQRAINTIEGRCLRDQDKTGIGTVVPIVHAKEDNVAVVCRGVAERLNPIMIAVPERELGSGTRARAASVRRVRAALNSTGQYFPIHLLGTGNPRAIAAYSFAGADSFDGLEWCHQVADPSSHTLHHFHQRDILACDCAFCADASLPYDVATLSHNLLYYQVLMHDIRESMERDEARAFLCRLMPPALAARITGEAE